jgi:hypothetical protein
MMLLEGTYWINLVPPLRSFAARGRFPTASAMGYVLPSLEGLA